MGTKKPAGDGAVMALCLAGQFGWSQDVLPAAFGVFHVELAHFQARHERAEAAGNLGENRRRRGSSLWLPRWPCQHGLGLPIRRFPSLRTPLRHRAACTAQHRPESRSTGGEQRHGQLAGFSDLGDEFVGGSKFFGPLEQFRTVGERDLFDVASDLAHVPHGFDDVAGTGLTLGADHACALGDSAKRLTEVRCAAHERHREVPLVDVVGFVGRGQHFGLIDEINAERFEDLGFDEVTDPNLGHNRDRADRLDFLDHLRITGSGDASIAADPAGNPLKGHNGAGTRVFGDFGLLDVHDIHDHAALQHFGQAALRREPFRQISMRRVHWRTCSCFDSRARPHLLRWHCFRWHCSSEGQECVDNVVRGIRRGKDRRFPTTVRPIFGVAEYRHHRVKKRFRRKRTLTNDHCSANVGKPLRIA